MQNSIDHIAFMLSALIHPSLPLASVTFIQPLFSSIMFTLVPSWSTNKVAVLSNGPLFTFTELLKTIPCL